MKRISLLVAGVLLTVSSTQVQAQGRGRVIGFVAAFKGLDAVMDARTFANYTQVDLAFVNPTPGGDIADPGGLACAPAGNGAMISDAQLRQLVASAHQAGATFVASLGGATIPPCGGDWETLLSPPMRAKVIAGILAMVDRYSLDGVDIDLEGALMMSIDRSGNYTPFVRELAEALHARSKLLSAATGSSAGGMIPDASLPYLDLVGIMSYDAVGPTWGTPGAEHSTYAQAQADLALWIGKGIPASRLALGVPFYGHGFGSYKGSWNLSDIAAKFGERQLASDVVGQRCAGCSYITYNGLPTLERKAELAGQWGAGVMVWEVGGDLPGNLAIRSIDAAYAKARANARHN